VGGRDEGTERGWGGQPVVSGGRIVRGLEGRGPGWAGLCRAGNWGVKWVGRWRCMGGLDGVSNKDMKGSRRGEVGRWAGERRGSDGRVSASRERRGGVGGLKGSGVCGIIGTSGRRVGLVRGGGAVERRVLLGWEPRLSFGDGMVR